MDPQRFVDHYTANGWRVGKSPMRYWRAAVRTWEHNGQDHNAKLAVGQRVTEPGGAHW